SIGDPYAPELGNMGYDVTHYNLLMALDPAVTNIDATVIIEGVVTSPTLATLSLDFVGFEISEVLLDGQLVDFVHEDDKLILFPSQPWSENSLFEISVSYAGAPEERPSPYVGFAEAVGMHFVRGKSIFVLSEPDGARFWFPNNDHPRDKAIFRFEITVPAGLTAVANGLLLEQIDATNHSTFIWEHDFPMASYLATVVVDEFVRLESVSSEGILLRHYVPPEMENRFETITNSTEAIEWMGERFGSYPFEAFGYVLTDVQGVSLETQTMVLLANDMMSERVAIHELAHMWFGDWVSLDSWQQMWRNEGFATYVQLMWETQDDAEDLALVIEAFRAGVEDRNDQHPLGNPPPIELFGYNTYIKGAVMVHELRLEVGDDAFFDGLQTYFATYGGGSASDAQFQAVMEEASGNSLDAFFAEWLE
ncbi:MAG: M1 family metallopeptidase, partial [Chloroflexi bacterium]|nr:M1 family metallopeptidase [Chloroflexota bacterium]